MKHTSLNRFLLKPLLAAVCLASSAHADLTWNSGGLTNNWSTVAGNENWTGPAVWTQNENAIFNLSSGTPEAVTVTTIGTIFNNITFDVSGFSIAAGAGSLLLANDQASTITVTTGTASIAETISDNGAGTSTLTKAGNGTLTLSGANGYTGLTTISQGRLIVSGTGTLGTNSNAFVDTNGTLEFASTAAWNGALTGSGTVEITTNSKNFSGNNSAFAGDINVLTGGGRLNFGASNSGSANAAWTVDGILAAVATVDINLGSLSGASTGSVGAGGTNTVSYTIGALDTDTTYNGTIIGSGGNHTSIVKVGTGTLTLTNTASAYDRSTTINNGTLEVKKVAAGAALSSIGQSSNAATNLVINGGTLKFTGTTGNGSTDRLFTIGTNGATLNASSTDNTALTFTNVGSLATTAGATDRTLTLTGSTTAGTLNTIASVIVNPTGGGKTAVTKSGGNTWVLSGANSYTGKTTVEAGKLALGASGSISSTLELGTSGGSTGTLDVTAKASFSQTSVSGSGTLEISATNAKTINVTSALAPGFNPGEINVIGNLSLVNGNNNTITTMQLSGNGGDLGVDSDYVSVTGTLTLDGILNIVSYGGYDLDQAGTYDLFDAGIGFAGDFDDVNVGALTNFTRSGDIWTSATDSDYSFNESTGVLTVIPEPAAALLGSLGMLALLRRRRN